MSQGKTPAVAGREAGISQESYYRWRKKIRWARASSAKRMKEVERENVRLERPVADLSRRSSAQGCSLGKSPERRRQAVQGIQAKYRLSERHAFRIVDPRDEVVRADEDALTRAIVSLASRYRVMAIVDHVAADPGGVAG